MHFSRSLLATAATAVLALLLAAPAFATFPGDNGRIAYTNQTDDPLFVIETVEPDGSDVQPLTDTTSAQGPSWSPDGSRILFSQDNDIWIMDADGSNREQLTDTDTVDERRPSFSPDGNRIVYSERNYGLYVMDADGSNQDEITPTGFDFTFGPAWSPDGSRIAFIGREPASSDAIYTMAPDGTDVDFVANPNDESAYSPTWSPDGERMAFYTCPAGDCTQSILYVVDAAGDDPAEPISDAADGLYGPSWSPDGTLIAATDGDDDIVTIEPDGENLTPVLPDTKVRGGLHWQTLPHAPATTTGDATDITQTGVTLNGVVNPATRAFDTTYRFEYGPTADYGASTDEVTLEGTTEDQAVSAVVDGLQPGTQYHYRLVATNESGTTTGEDRTFTTVARPVQPQPQPPAACPPGTVGVAPQCVAIIAKEPAKMSLLRATMDRRDRTISILAPITKRASGSVRIRLHAAGRFTRFNAPIDTTNGWIRVVRKIPRAQAELGTGILTIRYPGDEDTRPQRVRSRAANNKALLTTQRPEIVGDRLQVSGTVNPRARGKVRVILQYQVGNDVVTRRRKARIRIGGQWGINSRLAQRVFDGFAQRVGTVHSYIQFTGYFQRRIRGEQRSFQVLGHK